MTTDDSELLSHSEISNFFDKRKTGGTCHSYPSIYQGMSFPVEKETDGLTREWSDPTCRNLP
jgi:hypothetical protein